MEKRLVELYDECKKELDSIGIDIDSNQIGIIKIGLSKRNNKRYGCCKHFFPIESTKKIVNKNRKKYIIYDRFRNHEIEISPWVMDLDKSIIKNTIMHEIIHCFPSCNNHGKEFKKYAKYINENLGYEISRVGNKEDDYRKSKIAYNELDNYKYIIRCENCGQEFFRKRYNKKFVSKYRCGKCGGKFIIFDINSSDFFYK